MSKESILAQLLSEQAAFLAMADEAKKRGSPIKVESVLNTIARQESQLSRVHGGDPITGKGITK